MYTILHDLHFGGSRCLLAQSEEFVDRCGSSGLSTLLLARDEDFIPLMVPDTFLQPFFLETTQSQTVRQQVKSNKCFPRSSVCKLALRTLASDKQFHQRKFIIVSYPSFPTDVVSTCKLAHACVQFYLGRLASNVNAALNKSLTISSPSNHYCSRQSHNYNINLSYCIYLSFGFLTLLSYNTEIDNIQSIQS